MPGSISLARAAGLAGAVLLLLGAAAWKLGHRASAAPAPQPAPVAVAAARIADVPVLLRGIGHVEAYNTVNVMPQVSGQIVQIAFKEGQAVHQGDLLLQIDPRTYRAKLEQDQANLAKDTAHRDNAQLNLTRYQTLEKSGAIAAQQVDSQASQVAQMQATLLSDKAQIDQDRLSLGFTSITAPIGGIAGFQQADIGNLVAPGGTTPLLTITQVQPIEVAFTLPQSDLPAITAHQGGAPLAVEAWSQDGSVKLDSGTLDSIDNHVDPGTGTITLKAVFANPGNRLWPGQFVEARLILARVPHAITIPSAAVERGPGGSFAWIVTPRHTAQARAIAVTQMVDGTALVARGLAPGELVVTDGQYGLSNGVPVSAHDGGARPLQNTPANVLGIVP